MPVEKIPLKSKTLENFLSPSKILVLSREQSVSMRERIFDSNFFLSLSNLFDTENISVKVKVNLIQDNELARISSILHQMVSRKLLSTYLKDKKVTDDSFNVFG